MDPISTIIGVLSLILTAIGAYVAWRQWQDSRAGKPGNSDESVTQIVETTVVTNELPIVSLFTAPPAVGRMIGRDALLKNLVEGISTHRFNAVVIEGIAGIGKTTLAAALAQQMPAVRWINCRGEEVTFENFSLSVAGLALEKGKTINRQVFLNPNPSNSARSRAIISILSTGEYRIMFDDFHLVKDQALKALLQAILEQCPDVALIFTTRVRLEFLEDASFRILPRLIKLGGLSPDAAIQYLRELGEVYPELNSVDGETFRIVWQRAGMGHPVALKMFAMFTRYHPVAILLDELGEYYGMLDKWVERLVENLSAYEVSAMSCLSVFREPVSEKGFFHLFNEECCREVLHATIDRFLVERNSAGELYLHPILQDSVYSNLLTPEQRLNYHRLAGGYFEALGAQDSNGLRNMLEAYYHYQQAGASELAVKVAGKMKDALFDAGQFERLSGILMELEQQIYQSIAEEAVEREPILFLGGGEVANVMATALDPSQYVTIIIDRRLSVASRNADFQLFLDNEGFRNTGRIIEILKNIGRAISNAGALLPSVITDYYGFDAKQVFGVAENLGYRVFPNKMAAHVAADKIAFWEHFRRIPEIAPTLIPRTWLKIPQVVVRHLLAGDESLVVDDLVKQVKSEIRHVGLPCVLKLANSELGYGQSIIRADEDAIIYDALRFAIEQSHEHGINPEDRIILEKEITRPFHEIVQVAVRHLDPVNGIQTTFAPPILVGHASQEILFTASEVRRIVQGPFVLDFAIQCDIQQMPSLVQINLSRIRALTSKMIESLGHAPGIYGVCFFITERGIWIPDDIPVKAEDTMFVTQATQFHSIADILARCLAGKPIQADTIRELQFAGGVHTILWHENKSAELQEIVGQSEASVIPGIYSIETYDSKIELRPLRLMGIILARLPKQAPLREIENCLDEALSKLDIVPRD